jgi:hypothetical protein
MNLWDFICEDKKWIKSIHLKQTKYKYFMCVTWLLSIAKIIQCQWQRNELKRKHWWYWQGKLRVEQNSFNPSSNNPEILIIRHFGRAVPRPKSVSHNFWYEYWFLESIISYLYVMLIAQPFSPHKINWNCPTPWWLHKQLACLTTSLVLLWILFQLYLYNKPTQCAIYLHFIEPAHLYMFRAHLLPIIGR